MVFVGRTDLLELIDRLVEVSAGEVAAPPKPVLVLEGCGGSGRSAVLGRALAKWQGHTPSVLVRPLEQPFDLNNPVRTVLAAVMLGLSVDIPGYAVAFPRLVIAQIVIAENFGDQPPDEQLTRLRLLLNQYQRRAALVGFVQNMINLAGSLAANIKVPGVDVIAPAVANTVSDAVVGRLLGGRLLGRVTWGPKAAWFGHQDLDLRLDAERALIGLSNNARSLDPRVRRDVDDVLVGALLADLRHSVAKVKRRTSNVFVLIDDADAQAATPFLSSVLRVRRSIAATGAELPDPLTIVAASSGVLVDELAGLVPAPAVWSEPLDAASQVLVGPRWARVRLPELSESDVRLMAKDVDLYQSENIGHTVYRLTRGHPAATALVLRLIKEEPQHLTNLDGLLRSPGPEPGVTVEQYLLRVFGRGLSVRKLVRRELAAALITVSAARHKAEARNLVGLLPPGVEHDSILFKSRSLWTATTPGGPERLPPLLRLLGLRALVARTRPEDGPGLERVLGTLLEHVAAGDRGGRLAHARLLNGRGAVVDELTTLLAELSAPEWLTLFDAVVELPDPVRRDGSLVDSSARARTPGAHIGVLIALVPAFESDIGTPLELKAELCRRIAHSYEQLAEHVPADGPFLLRANRYRRLADQFE
ncbi:hypothetical protein [Nocardia brasiliensis]|uniref:hypothetical protein n=1 Tax=Nocardia brasiliensis TaxID=37326 RepID=UPI0011DDD450|nr:hypothetical protein [Nocardia brasiliensis]